MIRRLGFEAQRVLFGMDKNEAYDQGICIRCKALAKSQRGYMELESLCHACYWQVSDISFQPIPIKLSIQVGEYVGDCIAVPPEWDGSTCLNALVSDRIAKPELRRLCELAEAGNSVIRLPAEANPHHTIFLVPKAHGTANSDRLSTYAAILKLLKEVCDEDARFTTLLITHFSREANPSSLAPLSWICQAIAFNHLFKNFGSLQEIFIGANSDAVLRNRQFFDKFNQEAEESADDIGEDTQMQLRKIDYETLKSKQKEIFNFQKVAGLLADYGFNCIKLADDWQGADFLAYHKDGIDTLKVQLKSRLTIDKKYIGKELFVAFPYKGHWYLVEHDTLIEKVGQHTKKSLESHSWISQCLWHTNRPNSELIKSLTEYKL